MQDLEKLCDSVNQRKKLVHPIHVFPVGKFYKILGMHPITRHSCDIIILHIDNEINMVLPEWYSEEFLKDKANFKIECETEIWEVAYVGKINGIDTIKIRRIQSSPLDQQSHDSKDKLNMPE